MVLQQFSFFKPRSLLSTMPSQSRTARRNNNAQQQARLIRWIQPAMTATALLVFLHFYIGLDLRHLAVPREGQPAFKPRIRSLHLLGERHSGTTWMHNHLKDCFGHAVSIRPGLHRWKHWFQQNGRYAEGKAFVVVIFRDPIQWLEAMHTLSHHANDHYGLPWKQFVTKPWTMEYFGKDLKLGTKEFAENNPICLEAFSPREVIPCLEKDAILVKNADVAVNFSMRPTYELRHDGSGKPYGSIVELRRDKIINFLSIAHYDGILDYEAVRYEDMVQNGTESLIRRLEKAINTTALCRPDPPKPLKFYHIEEDYLNWLKENIDWAVEALIGYSKP